MTDMAEIRRQAQEARRLIHENPPTREEALTLVDCIDSLIATVAVCDLRGAIERGDLEEASELLETLAVMLDPDTMTALRESLAELDI
jgi:hypothetical protein